MKSISFKFVLVVGILVTILATIFLYTTWLTTKEQLLDDVDRKAELALEFDLAIRNYVRRTIRPFAEQHSQEGDFVPEVMSTSFVARRIFDEVRENTPGYVIKFSSASPRNPANAAGPEELKVLRYFQENPKATRWAGKIQLAGQPYRAVFSPQRMGASCVECHGNPEDAPASLVARYGSEAGFHHTPGEVIAMDMVAIPIKHVDAALAHQIRHALPVLTVWLVLLFAGVLLAYRWIVGRRLNEVTRHFRRAIDQADGGVIDPIPIRGNDEIAVMAASFNSLADRFQSLYKSLDDRVRRRTADLEAEVEQRRLAERQLRESREFLQTVIDAIPDPTIVIGTDYRVVLANRAATLAHACDVPTTAALCHQLARGLAEPCPSDIGLCPVDRVIEERAAVTVIQTITDPDGEQHIFEVSAAPLFDESGDVTRVVASYRDITSRKRAEDAVKESEALVRTMASAAQDGIVLLDHEGNVSFWNDAATKIFGYTRKEMLGQNIHQRLTRPVDRQKHHAAFPAFQCTGRGEAVGKTIELVGVHKRGHEVSVELSLSSVMRNGKWNAIGILRDLTERVKAEAELRKLSMAVEQSPAIVVITDPNGNIEYVNPRFTEVTGYTFQEAVGKNPRLLKSEEMPPETYVDLWNTITSGRTWRGEFLNVNKSGERYWEAASISPITDRRGVVTHFVAVKEDITKRKQTEATLAQKEEQLRQSQKLEAIGSLAGGIAHEFNNLLQAIRGFTAFAMQELKDSEQSYQDLEQAMKAADRAAALTRQLLNFSRRDKLHLEMIEANDMVVAMMNMIRPLIGENVELDVQLSDGAGKINGDPAMLQQVLMNLCINARDAMPTGGKLSIRTGQRNISADYTDLNPNLEPGSYICISVTDTGSGMSREVVQHVFEPFFTTKEVGRGTGLGLAMALGVVQQHHGTIHVYSEPENGTTFKIYLPIQEGHSMNRNPQPGCELLGGSETILVAEDEPVVRDVVARILERAGYTILAAQDGQEAVALLEENVDQVALALLDVVMPRMSGRDACQRIKSLKPDVAIVFCTGYDPGADQVEFVVSEGLYLVEKPFDARALLRAVREALDARASSAATPDESPSLPQPVGI